jgi:4-amino-4-deoxy-L-arabinose transferase-like glycosyltransferase
MPRAGALALLREIPGLRVALLIAAAFALYSYRLRQPDWGSGRPPRYVFDEKYTAMTAHRIVRGDSVAYEWAPRRINYRPSDDLSPSARVEWTSPPGAPLAVAASVGILGFSEVGARAMSVVAAIAALIATAILAGRGAWFAVSLLAVDGAFFVLARTAMPYIFLVAGLTVGIALLMRLYRTDEARVGLALIAGAALGFAVSVRLTAIPMVVGAILASFFAKERRCPWWTPAVVSLAVLVAYAATFFPHVLAGASLGDLIRLHRAMYWFHRHVPPNFSQGSPWYKWPLGLTPVLFSARRSPDGTAYVWCLANKQLWWLILPTLCWALWACGRRSMFGLAAAAVIAGTWLPWAAANRFGLSYYLVPVLPFVAAAAGRAVGAAGALGRKVGLVYLTVAVVLFMATYPMVAAVPLGAGPRLAYEKVLGLHPAASTAPRPLPFRPTGQVENSSGD